MSQLVPLLLTDDDLEEMATITEQDILRADQRWRKAVARPFRNLLVAQELDALLNTDYHDDAEHTESRS